MNSRSHQIFFCLLSSVSILRSFAQSNNSSECNQFCGNHVVRYPFGFSDGCEIKLNCNRNTGNITIGNFLVQNWTADHILISFPARCNRPVAELDKLFSQNYAPTWRNGLLLKNCSSSVNDCVIPRRLIRSQLGDQECNFNVTCYSQEIDDGTEFLDYEKVLSKGNCSVLHSSIMVETDWDTGGAGGSSPVTLEFQTAELGWWVEGDCKCDANANCTEVVKGGERKGFRCKCDEGYAGDGFADGEGCGQVIIHSSPRSHGNKVGILMGGVIAGGSSVVILAFILVCIKKRSASLKSILTARRLISEAAGNSSVPLYPYKEIERATNGFSERQQLGTGAYGTVYAGKLNNDEWVAIKKLRNRDHDSVEQVMNEIKLLSSVSHPNLVRLLGCCIENGEHILVYEFMRNGTLSEHLQRERGAVLPWTIRLTIAAETARAISYLHSAMNPPIYHRDIKSTNILLDSNFKSKVADFGLSRFGMTDDSHISTAPQGTPGYVDPQYHQNFHLSDKSDVYSFGVVLVEIITAMKVVDFSRPHSEINLAALAIDRIGKGHVDEIIDPYLEPNRDAWTLSSIHKMAEVAFRCLSFHRDMRPSMMEVADELEQIRHSSWAPLDETTYLGSSFSSSCSSPYHASEKSLKSMAFKKSRVKSSKVIVPSSTAEDVEDCSPVSVQDPWPSDQSSPSADILLANIVR
ncbi:wall-associated receptor kinase-like 14-like [Dorcoceras hygrometricum]|uniref:Wall-associated receptor kinase-like 14-like n=1 Tax=Dorcoceras hygrometricum TaxID=472368 RepID=A0A2Z7D7F4_9LAMI|nr:wall-associated receptor kinase-like 14-like [Dorcoceras hygrometricum]